MAEKTAYTSFAIPADLSEKIDTIAKIQGLHRSEFITQAIKQAIHNVETKKEG